MAPPAAIFLAMALLCTTASGLSTDPEDYRPQDGASAFIERLRQGTALADYLRPGNLSCNATCNNQTFSGEECQGAFKVRCHGSLGKPGRNATFVARIRCDGQWKEAGGNGSAASNPTGKEVVCNGAFHERVLAFSEVRNGSRFSAMAYGCAFMYSYEATGLGNARVRSHTCQGAETVRSMSSVPSRGRRSVTLKDMEAILQDVASDDDSTTLADDSTTPDDAPVADRRSPRGDRNVSVTCNSQEASLREPCHGTLQVTLEGRNVTVAQMCKGWWIPAPRERRGFTCSGDWTVGMSKSGGRGSGLEIDGSCTGHVAIARRMISARGHTFRGSREVCIGRADASVQLPEPRLEPPVDRASAAA
ncbi:unnamed protein product [Ostreobium quekettii]|uniref:Uncharacterized protein n=1 Tax=Ostreobium quekettii TaxID=121088 RepID=A0A8S1J844_9CHLO|nr:unnamed protein product [Ostreobium quekettii]